MRSRRAAIVEQRGRFRHQRVRIGDAQRGARGDRLVGRLQEIERVRTDERRRAHGDWLDQVVTAQRQQAAADERDVGRGVVAAQFSQRIAEHDRDVGRHRTVLAAPDERDAARAQQFGDRLEALRMPRHDDRQRAAPATRAARAHRAAAPPRRRASTPRATPAALRRSARRSSRPSAADCGGSATSNLRLPVTVDVACAHVR